MLRRLFYPHSLIVTCMMFILIWFLDVIRINLHFLNPFNETLRDYEITDIVYSRLRNSKIKLDNRIVLVHCGNGHPSRDTLRLMVDRIVDAGAKVLAIDIMLSEQKKPFVTDSLLRESLLRMENVVLANELHDLADDGRTFRSQVNCDTFFSDYVYTGFINFIDNDSSTIRLFSPREMTTDGECLSFAARIAKLYDPSSMERLFKRNNEVEEIFYSGNENQFVQFGPKDILDSTNELQATLSGKIVLIGFLPLDAWDKPLLDRHYTPLNARYTGRNTPDMYGVVIHANILRMILDNTYVNELPFWANMVLTFVFCYFNIHFFYQIFRRVSLPYQFITRFLQLGEIVLLFFIVALLFHYYRIKMDVAYWITALLLTFDAVKFYDNGVRKRFAFLSRIPYALPPTEKRPKKDKKEIEQPIEEAVPEAPKSSASRE
ncbi:MAG: CHASE2 domain-containing protein [Saprospiraceae bacterium]|nr:CHASE2 domain-containing protein [Saprospiraceae bacterium]